MSGEFGNDLFLSSLLGFFVDTTLLLWIYPVVAFTIATINTGTTENIYWNFLKEPIELGKSLSWKSLVRTLTVNFMYAVALLMVFVALALINALLITATVIGLQLVGVIGEVMGVEKVALVSALLILLGKVGKGPPEVPEFLRKTRN